MIRVVLVDDHPVVRHGYRRLIDAEPDLQVVGEAATAEAANALLRTCTPDVALVDLSLRGSSGLEAIRGLLARRPQLKVLVLSMHETATHVVQALRSGAQGYLSKCGEPTEVLAGIRAVMRGQPVFSREIAALLAALDRAPQPLDCLSPRELDVLRLLAQGDTTVEIGVRLNLSQKTVLNYLSLIRQKLHVESEFQLLQLAASQGLVNLDAGDSVGP